MPTRTFIHSRSRPRCPRGDRTVGRVGLDCDGVWTQAPGMARGRLTSRSTRVSLVLVQRGRATRRPSGWRGTSTYGTASTFSGRTSTAGNTADRRASATAPPPSGGRPRSNSRLERRALGWTPPPVVTFKQWVERYRRSYGLRKRSERRDLQILAHVSPLWDKRPIDAITRSECVAYIHRRENEGAKAWTVAREMGFLKALFNAAIEDELLAKNPWTGIKRPRTEARTRVLTMDEQAKFLASAERGVPAPRDRRPGNGTSRERVARVCDRRTSMRTRVSFGSGRKRPRAGSREPCQSWRS